MKISIKFILVLAGILFLGNTYACEVASCRIDFGGALEDLATNKTKWMIEISKITENKETTCTTRVREIEGLSTPSMSACGSCQYSDLKSLVQIGVDRLRVDGDDSRVVLSETDTPPKVYEKLKADILVMLKAKCKVSDDYRKSSAK